MKETRHVSRQTRCDLSRQAQESLQGRQGFFGRRKNTIRAAKAAVDKAGQYAFRDRKRKKRTFRALWIQRSMPRCVRSA
jgi:ribosomal protein L20